VLKKAGIVVAAAAAGLLAVSPLAFAGEGHHKGDDKGHHKADHKADHKHYSNNNNTTTTYDHSPNCQSAPQVADNSVDQAAAVNSPLAALLGLAANVAAPINAQTQAPILSCNNLEDLVDVNVSDNFQDNSRTIDASRTVNRNSNNGG
jgi:ABC-type Zn2+ transport system substrate-binding protein/surface adhesin